MDEPGDRGESSPGARGGSAAEGISDLLRKLAASPQRSLSAGWVSGLRRGDVVGHFEIHTELGRGGFGVVYEARDLRDDRLVALKTVIPGPAGRAAAEGWLEREASLAAKLGHPHIVTLFDHGETERGPYLVYELLRGETLEDRLHRGPLPPAEALRIAVAVAAALAHAHAVGVIHRDLKPSNVFLTSEGRVKVLDFGLAEIVYGPGGSRGAGTPGYMAPEQWREEPEDARTDVFAAAVVLFESLTGRLPYRMLEGRSEALDARDAPRLEAPGVPPALARLVRTALSPNPAGRPRGGARWHEALLRIARRLDERARWRAAWRRGRSVILPLALLAVGVGLYLAGSTSPADAVLQRVVLADIENLTGDGDFDGLSELLGTALEQSPGLVPITRTRSRDPAARPPGTPVDAAAARDLARRIAASAILISSTRHFGDAFVLELRAVDPASGADLFALKETAREKGSVPDAVDRLSDGVRQGLRQTRSRSPDPPVASGAMATRSLEAWRLYVLGRECAAMLGQVERCSRRFREALAVDPAFPLAHYELAHTAFFEDAPAAEQQAAVDAAMQRAHLLPPRERAILLAWRAHLQGDDAEALRLYGRLADGKPADREAAYLAGDLLYHQGEFARAIPWFEKAVDGPAPADWALDHLADSLHLAGRQEELRRHCRAWSELPPTPGVLHALSVGRGGLGEPEAALAAAQQALALGGGPTALEDQAAALFQANRLAETETRLRDLAALDLASSAEVQQALAVVLAAQGRRREGLAAWDSVAVNGADDPGAHRALRAAYRVGGGDPRRVWQDIEGAALPPWTTFELGASLAYLGDAEHARRVGLTARPAERRAHEALLAWKAGRAGEAWPELEGAVRDPGWRGGSLAFYRAEVALDAGRPLEAVRLLDLYRGAYRRLPFGMNQSWMLPRSLVLLARAHQQLGEVQRARTALDELLALWRAADPDLPLLAEARAMRRKLD